MDNIKIKTIGERIKAERDREDHKITLDALAEKIGVTRQTISKWEKGEGTGPTVWDLIRLCEFFDCDYGYLIGDYECRTRRATDIVKETSLSEASVTRLLEAKQDASLILFLNEFLESPLLELQKLAQAYISYFYARKIIAPACEKNKDGLTGKQLRIKFTVNDSDTFSGINIQEVGDYTEFNLLHSFLRIFEAKTK